MFRRHALLNRAIFARWDIRAPDGSILMLSKARGEVLSITSAQAKVRLDRTGQVVAVPVAAIEAVVKV